LTAQSGQATRNYIRQNSDNSRQTAMASLADCCNKKILERKNAFCPTDRPLDLSHDFVSGAKASTHRLFHEQIPAVGPDRLQRRY